MHAYLYIYINTVYTYMCAHQSYTSITSIRKIKNDQSSRVHAGHTFCTSKTHSQQMFDFNHR